MSTVNALAFILSIVAAFTAIEAYALDQLQYLASQSHYSAQIYQAPFSVEDFLPNSLDLALQGCQQSFKWRRWNCPSSNFFLRHSSQPQLLDAEDAYVSAITTAALLYTIAKDCAGGTVAGCGCKHYSFTSQCSDDPQKAVELHGATFSNDFHGHVRRHNYMTVTTLLKKSLIKQCGCSTMSSTGCIQEVCVKVLKPFDQLANDIRQMYDEGLELSSTLVNSHIIWKNVPLDSLVFTKESPNYCEPDAVPLWNGMRGRQCSHPSGEQASAEERQSCRTLCRSCGFQVRPQNVVTESRCNCKFVWGFQRHCEVCVNVVRQHYCH